MPRDRPVVLLLDEHDDSVAMYTIALHSLGVRVFSASVADDGFSEAVRRQADVVVLDARLSRNLDLMVRLRTAPQTASVRLVVLTSQSSMRLRDSAVAAGCDRYLVKPCLPDVLALEVRALLHEDGKIQL